MRERIKHVQFIPDKQSFELWTEIMHICLITFKSDTIMKQRHYNNSQQYWTVIDTDVMTPITTHSTGGKAWWHRLFVLCEGNCWSSKRLNQMQAKFGIWIDSHVGNGLRGHGADVKSLMNINWYSHIHFINPCLPNTNCMQHHVC